jgi:hypothetical protein
LGPPGGDFRASERSGLLAVSTEAQKIAVG